MRGGEGKEGCEGVREGEGAEGVKGVRRARSMEVTPSTASDGDEQECQPVHMVLACVLTGLRAPAARRPPRHGRGEKSHHRLMQSG